MQKTLGDALNECLIECVQENDRIIVLNCDVAKSVGIRDFFSRYPSNAIQLGICEQDMVLMAGGLASAGYIPVVTTFAKFGSLRVAEQISTFIAYPEQNVKIAVSHGGMSPAQDGVTHQAVEDLGVLRAIPGMTVVEPFDASSCKSLFRQVLATKGPVYFRMNRDMLPLMKDVPVTLGEGVRLRKGKEVALIAMGGLVSRALEAAEMLSHQGIQAEVAAIHTLKPLDEDFVLELAKHFGALVTVEDHNIHGGLGDAVCSVVSDAYPVPVKRVALQDTFAQSGSYEELLSHYHLTPADIANAAKAALAAKRTHDV